MGILDDAFFGPDGCERDMSLDDTLDEEESRLPSGASAFPRRTGSAVGGGVMMPCIRINC